MHVTYEIRIDRRLNSARRHVVLRGGKVLHITAFYPSIFPTIDVDVSRSLADVVRDSWFVAGSSLSWNGSGFLLLGEERFVRNKLALELSAAGCALYGDDVTILKRPGGRLAPYQKAVALSRPRHSLVARQKAGGLYRDHEKVEISYHVPPRAAGPHDPPAFIRHIFILEPWRAAEPTASPVTAATGFARLLDRTAYGLDRNVDEMDLLLDITRRAVSVQVGCSASRLTASLVLRTVEASMASPHSQP